MNVSKARIIVIVMIVMITMVISFMFFAQMLREKQSHIAIFVPHTRFDGCPYRISDIPDKPHSFRSEALENLIQKHQIVKDKPYDSIAIRDFSDPMDDAIDDEGFQKISISYIDQNKNLSKGLVTEKLKIDNNLTCVFTSSGGSAFIANACHMYANKGTLTLYKRNGQVYKVDIDSNMLPASKYTRERCKNTLSKSIFVKQGEFNPENTWLFGERAYPELW